MPFEPDSFDAVCMWDTIEHLPNPRDFLCAARRVLKRQGHLYLTTGDAGSLNARVRGRRWRQIHPPSHLQYFSRRTITELLRQCGFQVVGIETAAYYHTLYNIFAGVRLRGGLPPILTDLAMGRTGKMVTCRLGSWIDLGDIMFVAARPV
jgi:SAM-dependent methyltransferase